MADHRMPREGVRVPGGPSQVLRRTFFIVHRARCTALSSQRIATSRTASPHRARLHLQHARMAAHGVRLELIDLPPIPMFGRPIALRSRAHAAEYRRCGAPTTPRGGARFGRVGRPVLCGAGHCVARAARCHIPARSRVEQTNERAIKRQPRERNGLAGGRERCPAAPRAAWGRSRGRGRLLERVSECDVVHTMYGAGNNWPISFGSLAAVPVQVSARTAARGRRRPALQPALDDSAPAAHTLSNKNHSTAAYNVHRAPRCDSGGPRVCAGQR